LILESFGKCQLHYQSGVPASKELLFDMDEFTHIQWVETSTKVVTLHKGNGHKGEGHIVRLYGTKVQRIA
jgi:hypothetical protein